MPRYNLETLGNIIDDLKVIESQLKAKYEYRQFPQRELESIMQFETEQVKEFMYLRYSIEEFPITVFIDYDQVIFFLGMFPNIPG